MYYIMARPIAVVPVLTGAAARRFDKKADQASKRKHTIDCSEGLKSLEKILANAKWNQRDDE
jgi:hypothetical protein